MGRLARGPRRHSGWRRRGAVRDRLGRQERSPRHGDLSGPGRAEDRTRCPDAVRRRTRLFPLTRRGMGQLRVQDRARHRYARRKRLRHRLAQQDRRQAVSLGQPRHAGGTAARRRARITRGRAGQVRRHGAPARPPPRQALRKLGQQGPAAGGLRRRERSRGGAERLPEPGGLQPRPGRGRGWPRSDRGPGMPSRGRAQGGSG